MQRDQCGYVVTGAGPTTAERYDATLRSLLLFSDDVVEAWEATVADDPGFALGHVGRAYLRCLSTEPGDAAEARSILDGVVDVDVLTDRERRHLDAARAYAGGDMRGAAARLDALSVEYPHDALALVVGHQIDFFCGDAAGLRDRPGRVLLSWDPAQPLYGFVLGMHAFGLEETNLYPLALAAGMRALDAEQRDVWALHAVVHVHEMEGRVDDGIAFVEERREDWSTGNILAVHNAWHEALFRLDARDLDGVLSIYDTTLHHDGSATIALEMLDASSLLWRLYLDDVDTGDRWSVLADAWSEKMADGPWYVFNDVHAMMAFVGAGRIAEADALVERMRRYVAEPDDTVTNVAMTAGVGLPVGEAIVAFGSGRYDEAVSHLHRVRKDAHRFGGSHAQRDVLARTLLEAAIRAGDRALARALASERAAVRPTSSYNRRQIDRALQWPEAVGGSGPAA